MSQSKLSFFFPKKQPSEMTGAAAASMRNSDVAAEPSEPQPTEDSSEFFQFIGSPAAQEGESSYEHREDFENHDYEQVDSGGSYHENDDNWTGGGIDDSPALMDISHDQPSPLVVNLEDNADVETNPLPSKRKKVTAKKVYEQNFRQAWLSDPRLKGKANFFIFLKILQNVQQKFEKIGWLQAVANKPTFAWCSICKEEMNAHLFTLVRHAAADTHDALVRASKDCQETVPVTNFVTRCPKNLKVLELRIAAYIAANTSIRQVDDLIDLLKKGIADSEIVKQVKVSSF